MQDIVRLRCAMDAPHSFLVHLQVVSSAPNPASTRAHAQVGDVERVFGTLRADVEALFMTAPSVDLEQLHADLAAMRAFVDEQVGPTVGPGPACSTRSQ